MTLFGDSTAMKEGCPPHHWRIAEQDGQKNVEGRCVKCGALRMFRVSVEFMYPDGFHSDR